MSGKTKTGTKSNQEKEQEQKLKLDPKSSQKKNSHRTADKQPKEDQYRFLSLIAEQISDAVITTDLGYKITYTNRAFRDLYGYAQDELVGESPDVLNAEPLSEKIQDEIYRAVSTGKSWMGEVLNQKKDGSSFPCELLVFPLVDDEGIAFAHAGIQRDITQRKQAEKRLQDSEKKYRSLFETMAQGVVYHDRDGTIISVNPAAERILGLTIDEMMGRTSVDPHWRAVHEDGADFPGEDHPSMVALRTGKELTNVTMGVFNPRKNCTTWINVNAVPQFRPGEDKPYQVFTTFDDITDRKRAEEALTESVEKFDRIAKQSFDVIVTADLNGTITYASPSVTKVFGYDADEITSRKVTDFVPKTEVSRTIQSISDGAAGISSEAQQFIILRKNGLPADIEINTVPINEEDTVVGVQAIIRDITETKRLRELEARAQRLETSGQIAGQVAHDFNNLLAPLIGYPSLIREGLPDDHPVTRYVDDMEKSATKIAEINQQLLTLGRRGHYNLEPLDLNDVVKHAISLVSAASDSSAIEIDTDLCEDLMSMMGGPSQISRTVTNLIDNAVDAMQHAGTLFVKTENYYMDEISNTSGRIPIGEFVKLTLSDTGCGIPHEIIPKIFDPFFTTKASDKKRGSGLGLSVVDAVVRDHNGYVDVVSTLGHGTTFYLYFPVTRVAIKQLSEVATTGGTETILVVDDDEVQRNVSTHLLRKLGYRVTALRSGEDAVDFLESNPQAIVILDMVMPPGIDGAETYRRILDIYPEQRAIIVSGFAESERVKTAIEMGARAFVKKPLTLRTLAAAVRRGLDAK